MVGTKKRGKYQAVSFPLEFVTKVKRHVLKDDKYRSIAEFVKKAVETQMKIDDGKIRIPAFQDDGFTFPTPEELQDFVKREIKKELKEKNKTNGNSNSNHGLFKI